MKKLLLMLTLALVALAGCKKEPGPVFNVTSEQTMNFEAAGGNGTITYTIENPSEALSVIAQCEAEWITDITVGDQITFNVAENKENEAREATIAVAYGNLGFVVKVTQESYPYGSLLGRWRGKVYSKVTIEPLNDTNKIIIAGFPNSAAIGLEGYVMPDNTIRIPKQTFDEVYYPIDTMEDEPVYFRRDFIPLNGDELVIPYDSDHIYISDAFEIGGNNALTGVYGTYRGEADTLIRKQ